MSGWKVGGVVALVLVTTFAGGWFFLPSSGSRGFSPWDRLTGDTPSAKVTAYVGAVARGDEATALRLWELPGTDLPNGRTAALRQRRVDVTRALIAAGVHSDVTIRSVQWWRTCCEPGVIDSPSDAGGARLRVQLIDRRGDTLDYVVDVFDRDGAYWGAAADFPARHWVVRDVYPANRPPLFWTWGHE